MALGAPPSLSKEERSLTLRFAVELVGESLELEPIDRESQRAVRTPSSVIL